MQREQRLSEVDASVNLEQHQSVLVQNERGLSQGEPEMQEQTPQV